MHKPLPTQEYLISRLSYNSETGFFQWLKKEEQTKADKTWNIKFSGKPAAIAWSENSYRRICIDGCHYQANRIAWRIHTGEDPGDLVIDHIDRNKQNDAISNLRKATYSENQANRPAQSNNANGAKGVYWHARDKKWIARVFVKKKCIELGRYSTISEAEKAATEGRERVFGEFANHSGA